MNDVVTDMDNLRHMLGMVSNVRKRDWGYRNYFYSGEADMPSMVRLQAQGLVDYTGRGSVYTATAAGRAAVGLSEKQYRRHFPSTSATKDSP